MSRAATDGKVDEKGEIPKKKHPGGRPTRYRPEYCGQIIEFFSREPSKKLKKTITTAKGTVIEEEVEVANDFPTFERFAHNIGVTAVTVWEWGKKYPEFANAVSHARDLQKDFLVANALPGRFNPKFAVFVAINCTDMREPTSRQEHTFPDGIPLIPLDDKAKAKIEAMKAVLKAKE